MAALYQVALNPLLEPGRRPYGDSAWYPMAIPTPLPNSENPLIKR